jgi:hypothetical protein
MELQFLRVMDLKTLMNEIHKSSGLFTILNDYCFYFDHGSRSHQWRDINSLCLES